MKSLSGSLFLFYYFSCTGNCRGRELSEKSLIFKFSVKFRLDPSSFVDVLDCNELKTFPMTSWVKLVEGRRSNKGAVAWCVECICLWHHTSCSVTVAHAHIAMMLLTVQTQCVMYCIWVLDIQATWWTDQIEGTLSLFSH